jgi:hypothetical protein
MGLLKDCDTEPKVFDACVPTHRDHTQANKCRASRMRTTGLMMAEAIIYHHNLVHRCLRDARYALALRVAVEWAACEVPCHHAIQLTQQRLALNIVLPEGARNHAPL